MISTGKESGQVKKAVVLAAGEGKRLAPLTLTRPKHLIPVAGVPLLQHTLKALAGAGVEEVLLVVGYKKELIRARFGNELPGGPRLRYVVQEEYGGTAQAAGLGRQFTGDDPFLLVYGDLLVDPSIFVDLVDAAMAGPGGGAEGTTAGAPDAVLSLRMVEDPTKFGIIALDEGGRVRKVVEKPTPEQVEDVGNLVNAGIYYFTPPVYDAIDRTQRSPRGEYELTDSIQLLVDEGRVVVGFDVGERFWSDVGHPWQLLEANAHFLEHFMEPGLHGTVEAGATLKGKVYLASGAKILAGTYVEGPVYVGPDCVVGPNAYLRPYTSLCAGCKVGNSSEVKASVLLPGAHVPHLSYVGDSVLGEGVNLGAGTVTANLRLDKGEVRATVKGARVGTGRRKLGAILGDGVQVGINACLMPGVTIGPGAKVGANTVVRRDVPAGALVYVDQSLVVVEKGDQRGPKAREAPIARKEG